MDRETPLVIACKNGKNTVVKELLETQSIDVKIADPDGKKPLYIASGEGHVEIVRLLLDKGVEADEPIEHSNQTSLIIASLKVI